MGSKLLKYILILSKSFERKKYRIISIIVLHDEFQMNFIFLIISLDHFLYESFLYENSQG